MPKERLQPTYLQRLYFSGTLYNLSYLSYNNKNVDVKAKWKQEDMKMLNAKYVFRSDLTEVTESPKLSHL